MFSDKDKERFWSKVDKKGDDECWEWTACLYPDGYGVFRFNKKNFRSHRMSFMIYNNREIIAGMLILHSCDNRKCCNPHHLREGTHKENSAEMVSKNSPKKFADLGFTVWGKVFFYI